MDIVTGYTGKNPIYVRQCDGVDAAPFWITRRTATLLDESGNTSFPGTLTATNVKSNNETRLAAVEVEVDTKADKDHTHTSFDNDISLPNKQYINNDWYKVISHSRGEMTDLVRTTFGYSYELSDMNRKIAITISRAYFVTQYSKSFTLGILDNSNKKAYYALYVQSYKPSNTYNVELMTPTPPSNYSVPTTFTNDSFTFTIDFTGYDSDEYVVALGFTEYDSNQNQQYHYYDIRVFFTDANDISTIVNDQVPTTKYIVDWLYPVGAIYMSMNATNPQLLFGGTWVQIEDRFLLCSAKSSKIGGGSRFIQANQLPAHNHSITSYYDDYNYTHKLSSGNMTSVNSIPQDASNASSNSTRKTYTDNTGNGAEYWQPYMTCYCWYRIA